MPKRGTESQEEQAAFSRNVRGRSENGYALAAAANKSAPTNSASASGSTVFTPPPKPVAEPTGETLTERVTRLAALARRDKLAEGEEPLEVQGSDCVFASGYMVETSGTVFARGTPGPLPTEVMWVVEAYLGGDIVAPPIINAVTNPVIRRGNVKYTLCLRKMFDDDSTTKHHSFLNIAVTEPAAAIEEAVAHQRSMRKAEKSKPTIANASTKPKVESGSDDDDDDDVVEDANADDDVKTSKVKPTASASSSAVRNKNAAATEMRERLLARTPHRFCCVPLARPTHPEYVCLFFTSTGTLIQISLLNGSAVVVAQLPGDVHPIPQHGAALSSSGLYYVDRRWYSESLRVMRFDIEWKRFDVIRYIANDSIVSLAIVTDTALLQRLAVSITNRNDTQPHRIDTHAFNPHSRASSANSWKLSVPRRKFSMMPILDRDGTNAIESLACIVAGGHLAHRLPETHVSICRGNVVSEVLVPSMYFTASTGRPAVTHVFQYDRKLYYAYNLLGFDYSVYELDLDANLCTARFDLVKNQKLPALLTFQRASQSW